MLATVSAGDTFARKHITPPSPTPRPVGPSIPPDKRITTPSKRTEPAQVSPKPTTGTINGYDWVDLGLPSGTKWAVKNIGAYCPEGYGSYFAWGETRTKSAYTESTSTTAGKNINTLMAEGIIDSRGNLIPRYDAASAIMGAPWHMPTKKQCEELNSLCQWAWTTQSGVKGYKVTGPNGNSIFVPASGAHVGDRLLDDGDDGCFWSASAYGDAYNSYATYYNRGNHLVDWYSREQGRPIRAVAD